MKIELDLEYIEMPAEDFKSLISRYPHEGLFFVHTPLTDNIVEIAKDFNGKRYIEQSIVIRDKNMFPDIFP